VIKIIKVVPWQDAEALNQITLMHLKCFRAEELDESLFQRGWWWIAQDDGEPVGFAGMVQSYRWGDAVYFCRAAVLPKARGNGLQKRLIATRTRKAKQLGMNWAITDTRKNPASANSLISAGFRMYEPALPWGLKDGCYWKKRINA
jgi:GNAT superfamily N-acetyltransferase